MDKPAETSAREIIRLARKASERSQGTGDIRDLDAAVVVWQAAVDAAGRGEVNAADRAEILSEAAGALLRRYQVTRRDAGDLAKAHRWVQEAMDATPGDAPKRLLYLSNAGVICQNGTPRPATQPRWDRRLPPSSRRRSSLIRMTRTCRST